MNPKIYTLEIDHCQNCPHHCDMMSGPAYCYRDVTCRRPIGPKDLDAAGFPSWCPLSTDAEAKPSAPAHSVRRMGTGDLVHIRFTTVHDHQVVKPLWKLEMRAKPDLNVFLVSNEQVTEEVYNAVLEVL